jgi:hypothetical protein
MLVEVAVAVAPVRRATGAVTKKKRCWPDVSAVSHSGREMTIVVEIARYTATDAILEPGSQALTADRGDAAPGAVREQ